ncbi:inositol monophosphatase [Desulfofundulus sp. TPOSR]|uniref:inositol monophosphatase family protein n=1 Tax=Desulfofundulus sp. TPOSR TaxID=2714340 RepID=UPI001408F358|nr:inositol monophosphatase [Desulfofundulus sp. TPOSR]NHM28014.1 inositol monophosphatase [Desulfofundulus sp. TPOSR]
MDCRYISEAGRRAVLEGATAALAAGRKTAKIKGRDVVTAADLAAQGAVRKVLGQHFPGVPVLSEEDSGALLDDAVELPGDCFWVVDPVDGTVNFSRGLPFWRISVAFFSEGKPVAGFVYAPELDELFGCVTGFAPALNGKPVRPSAVERLSEALIDITLLPNFPEDTTRGVLAVTGTLARATKGVRVLISGALSLCWVACGRLDGLVCHVGGFFSFAAASVIARKAGCVLTDFSGVEYRPGYSRNLAAASTPDLHRELLEIVQSF